jgi:hypothetical protein
MLVVQKLISLRAAVLPLADERQLRDLDAVHPHPTQIRTPMFSTRIALPSSPRSMTA